MDSFSPGLAFLGSRHGEGNCSAGLSCPVRKVCEEGLVRIKILTRAHGGNSAAAGCVATCRQMSGPGLKDGAPALE